MRTAILIVMLSGCACAQSGPRIDINTQTKGVLGSPRGGYSQRGASLAVPSPTLTDDALVKHLYFDNESIAEVRCWVDSGEVDINLEVRPTNDPISAGTNVLTASLACTSATPMAGTTSIANPSVLANQPMVLRITDVIGTPSVLNVFIKSNPQ